MSSAILEELRKAVIEGDSERAREAAQKAIDANIPPLDAISKGLGVGVKEIGDKFGAGEVFLVELIVAGKAMKDGMSVLLPAIQAARTKVETAGKIIMGTVEGDIHSIGKDIVSTLLEANGFEVINIGEDVPAKVFAEAAREHKADIVGVSALLTSSMPKQREVVQAIEDAGLADVKVMIGGAPTTRKWAEEIGADGWAGDAITAASTAKELMAAKRT